LRWEWQLFGGRSGGGGGGGGGQISSKMRDDWTKKGAVACKHWTELD